MESFKAFRIHEESKKVVFSFAKKKLTEISQVQIDMRMLDIETARKINKVMTPEQLAKWRDIQAKMRKSGGR